jgi:hypothetical protein
VLSAYRQAGGVAPIRSGQRTTNVGGGPSRARAHTRTPAKRDYACTVGHTALCAAKLWTQCSAAFSGGGRLCALFRPDRIPPLSRVARHMPGWGSLYVGVRCMLCDRRALCARCMYVVYSRCALCDRCALHAV